MSWPTRPIRDDRPSYPERKSAGSRAALPRGERAKLPERDGAMKADRSGPPRPAWFFVALLAWAPVILVLDGTLSAPWPWQYVLGAATFGVLWLATTRLERRDRAQVWLCVGVATGFEYLGSQVWGGYRYRFGGIPLFVPPGHGLIYVFAIALAATEWVRRYERAFTYAVFGFAAAWVIAGLVLLPPVTNRLDVHGAMWLPLFAYVVLFSPRRAIFAAIFIATTDVELAGTWTRSWTWMTTIPWYHVGSGNPPSAIAGGYAIIDGTVLLLSAPILRSIS